ncbi:MAG: M24 family metallopeptidase [Anaerolineae bacterium]|nr:M24 family metallopeptidase [Anaerolineae bacterium]
MKTELDAIMQARQLDGIIVTGSAQHNPAMVYLTGGAHITHGILVKARGQDAVLYVNPMERDEAAATGLRTELTPGNFMQMLKDNDGDYIQTYAQLYQMILTGLHITKGRLAVYGKIDAGESYAIYGALQARLPELEIVGEVRNSAMLQAMETKDAEEAARIRKMGEITVAVVGQVAAFIQSHKAVDGELVSAAGTPLTIGDIKNKINLLVAEHGVENPHGCIFAIGRDSGVPHSTGSPQDTLRLGETIVFDIFLQEAGGGYHYDFTRTWCLGYAPPEAQALYDDVLAVFTELMDGIEANMPFHALQQRTCELFEARGHPTVASDPKTQSGYVHGIGHGLGLQVHENPSTYDRSALLRPGVVVTVEPGLYYPERGLGCRLEDSIYVHSDGRIEVLAHYPLDLVLPVQT